MSNFTPSEFPFSPRLIANTALGPCDASFSSFSRNLPAYQSSEPPPYHPFGQSPDPATFNNTPTIQYNVPLNNINSPHHVPAPMQFPNGSFVVPPGGLASPPSSHIPPLISPSPSATSADLWSNQAYSPPVAMGPVGTGAELQLMLDWHSSMVPDSAGVVNFAAAATGTISPLLSPGVTTGRSARLDSGGAQSHLAPLRCKRKAMDALGESLAPPALKYRINEERMAMCMGDLHLDNNNLDWHPDLEDQPWYMRHTPPCEAPASGAAQSCARNGARGGVPRFEINENSTLELCKELQVDLRTSDILPKVIRDEMNKSCMQIMLWRPPSDPLSTLALLSRSAEGTSLSSSTETAAAQQAKSGREKASQEHQSQAESSSNDMSITDLVPPVTDPSLLDDINMEF